MVRVPFSSSQQYVSLVQTMVRFRMRLLRIVISVKITIGLHLGCGLDQLENGSSVGCGACFAEHCHLVLLGTGHASDLRLQTIEKSVEPGVEKTCMRD
jgi:hypothetical protein